jgi:putative thioredoxin
MLGEGLGGATTDDLIRNGSDAGFMAEVVEESRRQPVIVDFWAPWCGPCRQLTPTLEKAVADAGGKVKLVKINVDENPGVAGQLRVQSIPAVYAFANGQPVDGFMGALPEGQVKAFIDRITGGAGDDEGGDLEALLAAGAESLAAGDLGGAGQAFGEALTLDPKNLKAIAGMARTYLAGGDAEQAREVAAMAPADASDPELASVRAALALAAQADEQAGEAAEFERRLAADAGDHAARLELAKVLAGQGRMQEAADHLLTIIEQDRAWNDEAARKQLLTVFEAAGPGSDVARNGRRRLSSILFS